MGIQKGGGSLSPGEMDAIITSLLHEKFRDEGYATLPYADSAPWPSGPGWARITPGSTRRRATGGVYALSAFTEEIAEDIATKSVAECLPNLAPPENVDCISPLCEITLCQGTEKLNGDPDPDFEYVAWTVVVKECF